MNTASYEADVTSLGRPFHTFAPATTGKARPPTVDRRQVGTSSRSVEADLSLRRCGMSATCISLSDSSTSIATWHVLVVVFVSALLLRPRRDAFSVRVNKTSIAAQSAETRNRAERATQSTHLDAAISACIQRSSSPPASAASV